MRTLIPSFKLLIASSLFLAATGYAAGPLVLQLEITNSGQSAENVVGKFTFPTCATLINIPDNFSWEPALHTLLIPIGDFASKETKTVSVQATADSQPCLEKYQITGDWYSDKAIPAKEGSSITLPKLSDIDPDTLKKVLFGIGLALIAVIVTYATLLYRRRTALYGLIIDADTKSPVSGGMISVFGADDNQLVISRPARADGRFNLRILPGRYYIVCAPEGYQQAKIGPLTLEKGKDSTQIFEVKRLN